MINAEGALTSTSTKTALIWALYLRFILRRTQNAYNYVGIFFETSVLHPIQTAPPNLGPRYFPVRDKEHDPYPAEGALPSTTAITPPIWALNVRLVLPRTQNLYNQVSKFSETSIIRPIRTAPISLRQKARSISRRRCP